MTNQEKAIVPVKNKSVDVSLIKNMGDLQSDFLKTRVKLNELEMKNRMQALQHKTVQYATAKFFPLYLTRKLFKNSGSIYRTTKNLFQKKEVIEKPKRGLLGLVKKIF